MDGQPTHTYNPSLLNRVLGKNIFAYTDTGILWPSGLESFPRPTQTFHLKRRLWGWYIEIGDLHLHLWFERGFADFWQGLKSARHAYWAHQLRIEFEEMKTKGRKFDQYVSDLGRYIRDSDLEEWKQRLSESQACYQEREDYLVYDLSLENLPAQFVAFLEDPEAFVQAYNQEFVQSQLTQYSPLFDSLEDHPLTPPQREACVIDQDNVLVVAGAGTGKTSTMYAKAAYLVQHGLAKPDEILMLAFASKAQEELQERVHQAESLKEVKVKTFHSLGRELLSHYQGRALRTTSLVEDKNTTSKKLVKFIQTQLDAIVAERALKGVMLEYLTEYIYQVPNDLEFNTEEEYLAYVQANELRDLAGNYVKSREELKISNWLYQQGIAFEYE